MPTDRDCLPLDRRADRPDYALIARLALVTDLVFSRAYPIVCGIDRLTRGQEWEMSIPRRAVIGEWG